jgi:iron complex transport system substrate-binding protein
VIAALAASAVLHAPPPADRAAGARGARWLASQPVSDTASGGTEADTVVAIAAAGADPRSHVAALELIAPSYATGPGAAAKVALAAVAAGRNPRCFARLDLVKTIRAGYADGLFGASIWDDALSIDALAGAGETVPAAAVRKLRALRRDGGYGFGLSGRGRDDPDSTGLALTALAAAGVPRSDPAVKGAAAWLLAHRTQGGWGSGTPNANSTALGVLGLVAAGRSAPPGALRVLRSLQADDGSFNLSRTSKGDPMLATNQAVPALLGRPFPVARRSSPGKPC